MTELERRPNSSARTRSIISGRRATCAFQTSTPPRRSTSWPRTSICSSIVGQAANLGPARGARRCSTPTWLQRSSCADCTTCGYYSAAWARATSNAKLAGVLRCLLGDAVELHHTTMHVKPPERGQPFPLHQDWPFYPHTDDRYVDVLLHLDDTSHENGEICFLPGSHLGGPLQHVTVAGGTMCPPHLPTDKYRLADTTPVPARRGDVVCFNINTVHGSYLNTTSEPRRLVRMGYRHPDNAQLGGQAMGRPGVMVVGTKPRQHGQEPYSSEA